MPANALVTGPPRSGKTTALERTVARLRAAGDDVEGLVCPELREGGERVGFEIAALGTDQCATMAHVTFDGGPSVGKYGVDVAAIDRLARSVLEPAIGAVDCLILDEIAPMQARSDRFVAATERALESATPVVAAIASDTRLPFVDRVRNRADVETFVVEPETRDDLPVRLLEWVRSRRGKRGDD
ncbi:nucleoside-triphosphatase [Halopiger goleimassiliensis]|uniref:nucleoside-triphosphatase n=1 Tax=Halopiger goleimassiliensis TaxID=1293048 RepID=UPI000677A0A1|nr:nucleoside-triphosphatase [Halopiger goleimassiliensis]